MFADVTEQQFRLAPRTAPEDFQFRRQQAGGRLRQPQAIEQQPPDFGLAVALGVEGQRVGQNGVGIDPGDFQRHAGIGRVVGDFDFAGLTGPALEFS